MPAPARRAQSAERASPAQVRETLELAATLRRGRKRGGDGGSGSGDADADGASGATVAQEVEAAMRRLGLSECADTLVVRACAASCCCERTRDEARELN
jgi:hypothetical protein